VESRGTAAGRDPQPEVGVAADAQGQAVRVAEQSPVLLARPPPAARPPPVARPVRRAGAVGGEAVAAVAAVAAVDWSVQGAVQPHPAAAAWVADRRGAGEREAERPAAAEPAGVWAAPVAGRRVKAMPSVWASNAAAVPASTPTTTSSTAGPAATPAPAIGPFAPLDPVETDGPVPSPAECAATRRRVVEDNAAPARNCAAR
jgi:hypothetical protein